MFLALPGTRTLTRTANLYRRQYLSANNFYADRQQNAIGMELISSQLTKGSQRMLPTTFALC